MTDPSDPQAIGLGPFRAMVTPAFSMEALPGLKSAELKPKQTTALRLN